LLRRDFPEQLSHLEETVLSSSFLSYKVLLNSERSGEGHHAAISDRVKELASKEIKLLEENQVAQHRFSNLKARLQSIQNDQDPRTPVTKLQEQVNQISSV